MAPGYAQSVPSRKRRLTAALVKAGVHARLPLHLVGLFIALILVGIYFTSRSRIFIDPTNLGNILEQVTFTGILAIGMTCVIVSGQIDLSVGSVYGLSAIFFALMVKDGVSLPIAVVLAIAAGAGLGAVNGALAIILGVPVIIVTLGTLTVFRGIAYWVTDGFPITDFSTSAHLFAFGQGTLIPWPSFLEWFPDLAIAFVVMAVVGHLLLSRTSLGLWMASLGSGNRQAALVSGVRIRWVQMLTLIVMGAAAGIVGVLSVAQQGSASPSGGLGIELDVIAAVIIGGASIHGGRGSVPATVLGVLLVGEVRNGLVISGVSLYGQQVVSGGLIIVAVAVDRFVTGETEVGKAVRRRIRRTIGRPAAS